jgi:hypothetical protein
MSSPVISLIGLYMSEGGLRLFTRSTFSYGIILLSVRLFQLVHIDTGITTMVTQVTFTETPKTVR